MTVVAMSPRIVGAFTGRGQPPACPKGEFGVGVVGEAELGAQPDG